MPMHGPFWWFAVASAALLLVCSAAEASSLDEALAYSSKHSAASDDDLIALASYPSISNLPEHAADARAAAQWLEKKLKRIGLQVSSLTSLPCATVVMYGWCRLRSTSYASMRPSVWVSASMLM